MAVEEVVKRVGEGEESLVGTECLGNGPSGFWYWGSAEEVWERGLSSW